MARIEIILDVPSVEKTVEWYKASVMNKLNIHNKTDLIKFAIRRGVITL